MDAVSAPVDLPAARKPWRLRHPRVARGLLYGGALVLGAAGWAVAARVREDARQEGLLTRVHGIDSLIRTISPELAIQLLRDDVLSRDPGDDVRRRALLVEAAALDGLRRFDEAEEAYGRLRDQWPDGLPRGGLTVPWANMRVRAGRSVDALALLDAPGATDGEPPDGVEAVRTAAAQACVPVEDVKAAKR